MLRTAATIDPEIAEQWPQDSNPRYTVHAAAAKALVTKPGARSQISAGHAADLLYGILSPELYQLHVSDRDWAHEQWEQWAFHTLRSQLCAD